MSPVPKLPEVRGSFGPRETFYLTFAGLAGLFLLVLTVRDAAAGVVGAPAVGLVVVTGLAFLIVFGGSDRTDRPADGRTRGEVREDGEAAPGALEGEEAGAGEGEPAP